MALKTGSRLTKVARLGRSPRPPRRFALSLKTKRTAPALRLAA